MGGKNKNKRVVSPENVPIHLYFKMVSGYCVIMILFLLEYPLDKYVGERLLIKE